MRLGSRGAELLEVVIATFVVTIVVASMATVLLFSSRHFANIGQRERASLCLNQLLETLRNYVTDNPSDATYAPGGSWSLPCEGVWALNPGTHEVTGCLPQEFRDSPYKATMSYTVEDVLINGKIIKKVEAEIYWENPP